MDTREQQSAQCMDRHLSVTANAGSGKTRVLVQRFVNILLHGHELPAVSRIKPSEIVAITFTRKAASEMLAKVVKKVENVIAETRGRKSLEKLRIIREGLTYARISTIHSFCSGLLRDYPIEAAVSPNFIDISEAELLAIKRDAILSVLEDRLESENLAQKAKTDKLFNLFSRQKVEGILAEILNNSLMMDKLHDFYDRDFEEYILYRNNILCLGIYPEIEGLLKVIGKLVSYIDTSSLKGKNGEKVKAAINVFFDAKVKTADLLSIEENKYDTKILAKIFGILGNVFEGFFTKSGTVLALIYKLIDNDDIVAEANKYSSFIKHITLLAEALKYDEYEAELFELAGTLFDIALEINELIEEEKEVRNGLYFDDMLKKTHSLLQSQEVCDKVRQKIKFLLVDEFQDTDDLQYDIIRQLVPGLKNDGSQILRDDINLFIVGDAKQSIYGFRNADVRVFAKAGRDIAEANSYLLSQNMLTEKMIVPDNEKSELVKISPDSDEIKKGNLKLSSTFRLQPAIAAFTNKVCGKIMAQRESSYDVEYNDFVCARNVDGLENGSNLDGSHGSVSLLLNLVDGEEENPRSEAELLANHILKLLADDSEMRIEGAEGSRKVNYNDIAILAPTRTKFTQLSEAFQKKNIPYIIHSGSGFYKSQEVTDFLSFLNFLYDRHNDIALLATLKAPFFGLNDAEILTVSNTRDADSFWDKLSKYCEAEPGEKIKRAYGLLTKFNAVATKLPISGLIVKIIEDTGYYGAIEAKPGRTQIEANIEKFLSHARDYANQPFKDFYDFVDELNFIAENTLNESEAADISTEDAVNIMTIHASKGLEFPVVILYNLNSKGRGDPTTKITEDFGISFPVPVMLDKNKQAEFTTITQLLASGKNQQKRKAEAKRVLYVAMTRAMDHLIISSSFKKGKKDAISKPVELMELVTEGLGTEPEALFGNTEFSFVQGLKILRDNDVIEKEINYSLKIITDAEDKSAEAAAKEIPDEISFMLNEIRGDFKNEYFSPSKLMLFNSDRNEYINKYILGFPGEDSPVFEADKESAEPGEEQVSGSSAGSMIHAVLENIPRWLDSKGKLHEKKLKEAIAPVTASASKKSRKQLESRILKECKNVASTKLLRKFANKLAGAKVEYNLYLPNGSDFINGMIDMLVQNHAGQWEIWDWKTNKVESEEKLGILCGHYEIQMKIYAWFAAEMFPEQEEIKARLLFTRLAADNAEDAAWTRSFTWKRKELLELKGIIHAQMEAVREYLF